MPKTTNPEAYPYTYYEAYKQAGQEPVEIVVPDKKTAENLRFDMYGYRKALSEVQDPDYYEFAKIKLTIAINLDSTYTLKLESIMDDKLNDNIMAAVMQSKERVGHDLQDTPPQIPNNSPATSTENPANNPPHTPAPNNQPPVDPAVPATETATDTHEAMLASLGYNVSGDMKK